MGNKQTIFTPEQLDAYQVQNEPSESLDRTLNNGVAGVFFKQPL